MNLSHLIYGKPRQRDEVEADLRQVERHERNRGSSTVRGDMLRFEIARQNLVVALSQALRRDRKEQP